MAEEILVSASLLYEDAEGSESLLETPAAGILANVSTKKFVHAKQLIDITPEAIDLGEIASPSWAMFRNLDEINFVELLTGTGGVVFAKIEAGETAGPFRLGSGAQAPFAKADANAVQIEFLVISA